MKLKIEEILNLYKEKSLDFENARWTIYNLGPDYLSTILEMAESGRYDFGLDILVFVMCDYDYPAGAFFEKCLAHSDVEGVALPAGHFFKDKFTPNIDIDKLYKESNGLRELSEALKGIQSKCLETPPNLISIDEWYKINSAKFLQKQNDDIPEQPKLNMDEQLDVRYLYKDMYDLLKELEYRDHIDFDRECVKRVANLYDVDKPYSDLTNLIVKEFDSDNLDKLEELKKELIDSLQTISNKAQWNTIKSGYKNPKAYASWYIAQAFLYAISDSSRRGSVVQGFIKDGIVFSGLGYEKVREELLWQISYLEKIKK